MNGPVKSSDHRLAFDRRAAQIGLLLLCLSIVLAVVQQVRLLDYLEWGDESETIVAAKMLAAGMSLYSEVFNQHGPLTFLPGWALESFGSFGVPGHRCIVAVLQVVALGSLYASPLMKDIEAKLIFLPLAIAAVTVLLPDSNLYGHTYTYQVLAGLLLMVILAQYTAPSLLEHALLRPRHVLLGNAGLAALPFLAITYLPAAVLLFLGSLRREHLKTSLIGVFSGLALNVAFLAGIGSFKGYLAEHIYLNSQVLPAYNGGQSPLRLAQTVFVSLTSNIEIWFAFVAMILAFAWILERDPGRRPWRSTLLAAAVLSLLMRGFVFQGAAFWYVCVALGTLLLAKTQLTERQRVLWLVASAVCVLRLAYPMIDHTILVNGKRQEKTEFGELARKLTSPSDKVIAYSFRNFEYLAADRLPASGHFFYLPWQEKYNERPQYGIVIDACREIAAYRPKLMLIDKWRVWGEYRWESYGACIQGIVDRDYRQLPGRPIFVRNDLFDLAMQLQASTPTRSAAP